MKAPLPESFLKARRALLLDHPFFGSLILHLEPVLDDTCQNIWVDGTHLGFSPTFFDTLSTQEGAGVLAHEILHCALEHTLRRGSRDTKLWNDATDYVINPMVRKSGLPLPKGVLEDAQHAGKTAEAVYDTLSTQKPQPEPGNSDGGRKNGMSQGQKPNPQSSSAGPTARANEGGQGKAPKPVESPQNSPSTGEVRDAVGEDGETPSPAEKQEQGDEWKVRIQQAVNSAKGQGYFPAELDRIVKDIITPKIDWREELRRFFQSISRSDSSWTQPNRRFIGAGLYLPGMHVEAVGPLVVAIDTSGSIGGKLLEQFAGELNAIAEDTRPEKIHVVYCDAAVSHVEEFTADDLPIKLCPKGGGGTDFRPVFDWVEKEGVQPDCLVYLTDGYGTFPKQEPSYPVMWALTSDVKVPFGFDVKLTLHY